MANDSWAFTVLPETITEIVIAYDGYEETLEKHSSGCFT